MRPSEAVTAVSPDSDQGHFAFGKNWRGYVTKVDDERIAAAIRSLQLLLRCDTLGGMTFLDAGCGSGIFSLAAYRLGANVLSFDLDPDSVAATRELQERYASGSTTWVVQSGSLTDQSFLKSLGRFDVVYCWGVAHHTGQMWAVIKSLCSLVNENGLFIIAIYNDQLFVSRVWREVKRVYQRLPVILRPVYVVGVGSVTFFKRFVVTIMASIWRVITFKNPCVPFLNWTRETQSRGMDGWHDLVDWVGGWPFEVARPEDVFRFIRDRGFFLSELTTNQGHGCNEFVFTRASLVKENDS